MGHSVEGRYPFLDYRVIEFCNRLPAKMKMPVLIEKWLLKQLGKRLLPDFIWKRNKRPYRAPIHSSFIKTHHLNMYENCFQKKHYDQEDILNPTQ